MHQDILRPLLTLLVIISCGLAGALCFYLLFDQPGKAIIWLNLLIVYVVLNILGYARLQSRFTRPSHNDIERN